MNVEELLTRAWAAVQKAGIPEPLHEYAFKEALTRLSGSTPDEPPPAQHERETPDPANNHSASKNWTASVDLSDPFAKFTHESGVPTADLERIFFFSEDGLPHLNGPRAKFGGTVADQAKVVAVAITAAHDFALNKKSVPDEVVRAEAVRLKISLGGNWARTMGGLQGASWVGPTRQKQFKNATPEALRKIVNSILGAPTE